MCHLYKPARLVVILSFILCGVPLFCQNLNNLTLSSSGIINNNQQVLFYSTIGETISGIKRSNDHIVIEGFYSSIDKIPNKIPVSEFFPQVQIYPNPSKVYFYIANKSDEPLKINVISESGQNIKKILLAPNQVEKVENLLSNVYLIRITDVQEKRDYVVKEIIN